MFFCSNTGCQYINRSATVVVVEAVAAVVVVASGSLLIVVVGASPFLEDSVVVVVILSLRNVVVVPIAWRSVFEIKERCLCRNKKLADSPLEECPRLTPFQNSLVHLGLDNNDDYFGTINIINNSCNFDTFTK